MFQRAQRRFLAVSGDLMWLQLSQRRFTGGFIGVSGGSMRSRYSRCITRGFREFQGRLRSEMSFRVIMKGHFWGFQEVATGI